MDFRAIYRVLVTNTSFYFNGCINNIIPLQKLLLLEGTEASFLLFSNKKIHIQIIPIRTIYYLKYGYIGCYFFYLYNMLVTNTSFYFNVCIKNIFPI